MQAPKDYVIEMIKTTLDDRINTTEDNLKCEIQLLRNEIKDFHVICRSEMGSHEKRIRTMEDFKLTIIVISGLVGAVSTLLFSLSLKLMGD